MEWPHKHKRANGYEKSFLSRGGGCHFVCKVGRCMSVRVSWDPNRDCPRTCRTEIYKNICVMSRGKTAKSVPHLLEHLALVTPRHQVGLRDRWSRLLPLHPVGIGNHAELILAIAFQRPIHNFLVVAGNEARTDNEVLRTVCPFYLGAKPAVSPLRLFGRVPQPRAERHPP